MCCPICDPPELPKEGMFGDEDLQCPCESKKNSNYYDHSDHNKKISFMRNLKDLFFLW